MTFFIDESTRENRKFFCDCCGTVADRTWAHLNEGEATVAVYFASCYHHTNGVHETWIDAILGTWGDGPTDDHVTFGCRVGPTAVSPMPGATLVDGGSVAPDSSIFGQKLSRAEGLAHPRLPEFWRMVDTILERDGLVRTHLYGR
ncbi:hypothetical protein BJY16_001312 [Actinoplanes octamycinicus]|uniref:Uncharacterized protein n=1 Tax=Actinoplanes octamycinicus TaxID=135948 RepID=A0A7W7M5L7_9ACTN|nr:hypothetical protein [Actinoplanes octamycinicus]MBB4737853.1 hypothetical protein [Actinoplanes octamycinicus]GIE59095.1 hypothetical protein Aoc01nite_44970 [Actinoplanes octamycinicus]